MFRTLGSDTFCDGIVCDIFGIETSCDDTLFKILDSETSCNWNVCDLLDSDTRCCDGNVCDVFLTDDDVTCDVFLTDVTDVCRLICDNLLTDTGGDGIVSDILCTLTCFSSLSQEPFSAASFSSTFFKKHRSGKYSSVVGAIIIHMV